MSTKLETKPDLRKLSEVAIQMVLGKVPRKIRRQAARRFANAASRQLRDLDPLVTKSTRANPQVTSWIVREYHAYVAAKQSSNVTAGLQQTESSESATGESFPVSEVPMSGSADAGTTSDVLPLQQLQPYVE